MTMNTFAGSNLQEQDSITSAKGAMQAQAILAPLLFCSCLPYSPIAATTTTSTPLRANFRVVPQPTSSGVSILSKKPQRVEGTSQEALQQLKKISGLTWEQISRLFGVSRRSIHFWASGQPLAAANEEHLYDLLKTIQYIDHGSAKGNRRALLSSDLKGTSPLELLANHDYEEVKQQLGAGNADIVRGPTLRAMSVQERASRSPSPPAELVDALHEPIHIETKKFRPAKSYRSRKGGNSRST